MYEGFNRAADASPVIDKLEAKWASDPKKGPEIQNLRGRVFLSQGKIEEAAKWVDDLYKRDPKAAAGPAGQLARALDQMGLDKFKAQPESLEGDQLWVRAARYYWISIEPQVKGSVSQNPDEMTDLGNRFYSYGLHFNGIPEPKTPDQRTTFVDWTPGSKRSPDPWVKAAMIYEAALAQNPSYRMTINLGRTYGFLAKWAEAAGIYGKLFEQEQIVDQKTKNKLDRTAMSAKPELVMAYIEWGVAERMAANNGADKARLDRAMTIMTLLCNTLKPDVLPNEYWAAHYNLVRTLMDRGEYKNAQLSIDDITRNVSPTFDNGTYGYKQRFLDTIEELKKK
jgi:tetratricopeptide (TPR) repeat protein